MRRVWLYPANVTESEFYGTKGDGALEALSAFVYEDLEAPSAYHATVTIPVSDRLAGSIRNGAVLGIPCADRMEPFRIRRVQKTTAAITAEAWHITYDLRDGLIENRAWEGYPLSDVWQDILEAGGHTEFHGTSAITRTGSVKIVRRSVLEAIVGDQDNSVINRWGGEVSRTGWTVDIQDRRGTDRDWQIRYGHNLTGINDDVDDSEVIHAVLPTYLVGDTPTQMPIETCPGYVAVDRPRTVAIHFGDIRVGDGEGEFPNAAAAELAVEGRIALMWAQGAHLPRASCTVSFLDLARVDEPLPWAEDVRIGDRIRAVWVGQVDIDQRVVRTEWDALAGRWDQIVLGQPPRNLGELRSVIANHAEAAIRSSVGGITDTLIEKSLLLNETYVNAAGYYPTVVRDKATGKQMMYIHDKQALEDSTFIAVVPEPGTYLWTDQGWNNGEPVWTEGMTKDGNALIRYLTAVGISADWINAGTMSASRITSGTMSAYRISGGILESFDGSTYFDLSKPEIVQYGSVGGQTIKVTMSPTKPFQVDIDGEKTVYISPNTGKLVTDGKYDINEDGIVDMQDVYLLNEHMYSGKIYPSWIMDRLDVNRDGKINSIDLNAVMDRLPLNLLGYSVMAAGGMALIKVHNNDIEMRTSGGTVYGSDLLNLVQGGVSFDQGQLSSSNLNNITTEGAYQLTTSYSYTNAPSGITSGVLTVFTAGSGVIQLLAYPSGAQIRYRTSQSWGSWRQITP